ncbi:MAG TPA: molecular chaperone TorD family protein [Myxococcota bacterium]|nr:molecular chaperone TorD family protein [Myxococcota bacterium]
MDADGTRALARCRAYDLLASLFGEGIRRAEHLRAVEAFRAFVPERPDEQDEVRFHRLFSIEVLPYESVFLSPERVLGGETTLSLWDCMGEAGFRPETEPDHLAGQLAFLSWLSGAEADAWHSGAPDEAARLQRLARAFMREHLAAWLPPLVVALQELDEGIYAAAAGMLLELTSSQLQGPPTLALPLAEELLADSGTGLAQVADWLASPARSGVWLTPASITAAGRARDLPRGFGRRPQLIENLLHTAVRHGALGLLLADLDVALELRQGRLESLPGGAGWATRVSHTRAQLAVMAAAA